LFFEREPFFFFFERSFVIFSWIFGRVWPNNVIGCFVLGGLPIDFARHSKILAGVATSVRASCFLGWLFPFPCWSFGFCPDLSTSFFFFVNLPFFPWFFMVTTVYENLFFVYAYQPFIISFVINWLAFLGSSRAVLPFPMHADLMITEMELLWPGGVFLRPVCFPATNFTFAFWPATFLCPRSSSFQPLHNGILFPLGRPAHMIFWKAPREFCRVPPSFSDVSTDPTLLCDFFFRQFSFVFLLSFRCCFDSPRTPALHRLSLFFFGRIDPFKRHPNVFSEGLSPTEWLPPLHFVWTMWAPNFGLTLHPTWSPWLSNFLCLSPSQERLTLWAFFLCHFFKYLSDRLLLTKVSLTAKFWSCCFSCCGLSLFTHTFNKKTFYRPPLPRCRSFHSSGTVPTQPPSSLSRTASSILGIWKTRL